MANRTLRERLGRPILVNQIKRQMEALVDPMTYEPLALNLEGIDCQEASIHSVSKYIACGAPAEALVWHEKDQRVYPMCKACAFHNVHNRGGRLLAGDRRILR